MLRDLDMELPHVADAWRLEVVVDGLPLHGGRHLLWTPRWLGFCTPMVNPCEELQTKMGCALSLLVAGKKGPAPNWLADGAEPRWLFSLEKSVDGGQERPHLS